MPLFAYRAVDGGGGRLLGRMEASNLADLESRLKRMGLDLINGETVAQRRGWRPGAEVPRRELINFCFHLEQLTRAGVPILETLADLRETIGHPRFRQVIAVMIDSIQAGKTLSQAMQDHPRVFDGVFVSLIRVGEGTGKLAEVLQRLTDSLKWQDELAAQTRRLVMYPALLGAATLGVTLFMMSYLVPRLAGFIRGMGQELPLQTRLLLATAEFLADYWLPLLMLPLLLGVASKLALEFSAAARYRYDRLKLALPYFGAILSKIVLARFADVFALLYASGISVVEAVRTTEHVVGNRVVREGLRQATRSIAEGQQLSAAFRGTGLFPPLVIRMLSVGESTGGLDKALENVSYFYDRDVRETVARAQTLIEPVLTLIVGLLLGWVLMATIGPIYEIIARLKT